MKKKWCSLFLVFVLTLGLLPGAARAADSTDITVYVTISDKGEIVTGKNGAAIAQAPVVLRGKDTDEYTIDDALRAAHDAYYDGGAEAGYSSAFGEYGLCLDMLWGDTSGAFGYCVNNVSAQSLADTLRGGDSICAYIYQDQTDWSDRYSYFDQHQASVGMGETLTLTLTAASGYDASWNPIYSTLSGASISINGTLSDTLRTDDSGEVALTFDTAGTYVVSGVGPAGTIIVPPVCVVHVVDESQEEGIFISGAGLDQTFSPDIHTYTLQNQPYTKASIGIAVNFPQAAWIQATNNSGTLLPLFNGSGEWTDIPLTVGKNEINFTVFPYDGKEAVVYTLTVLREVALSDLQFTQEGDERSYRFDPDTMGYSGAAVSGSKLKIVPIAGGDADNTVITINGADIDDNGYMIAEGANTYVIKVASRDGATDKTYTLTVTGYPSTDHTFTVPEGSTLTLTDIYGNSVSLPEGTTENSQISYVLSLNQSLAPYTWHVGKYGFYAKSGTVDLNVSSSVVTLTAAEESASDITAQWKNFRNSDHNMAVTAAKTPRNAAEAEPKWAIFAAATTTSEWGTFSLPTAYIMVDGKIITASGDKLSRIDPETGAVEIRVTMAASRGYAYMPPTYGGGMIYVALNGGMIQAFDARTLESKWVYTDPLGGQALSTITYDDGYIYTGFEYTGYDANDTSQNSWVCIPVADEVPNNSAEAKEAVWTYAQAGGFYWAGGYVVGDYIVVGADIGTLLVFDKKTGDVVDSETVNGNIRCAIAAYDTNDICFVTQSGGFYTAEISSEGQINSLTQKASIGGASTSTPLVIGGYAYVGVTAWPDAYVAQVDMTTGAIATIATSAYPQSSMLASTAYIGSTYLYFTCNGNPGGIQVIEVASDGTMTLSDLYIPDADKQNYCIASVMCDEEGTLYYTNDSGYLFAIGTWQAEDCPVAFQVTPAGAVIDVRNSAGETVIPARGAIYDLASGTYTYTITSGETRKNGKLTITDSYAANHVPQTVAVTLDNEQDVSPTPPTGKITVTIRVADPKGKTYLNSVTYTMNSGSTVYDLLKMTGLNIQSTQSQFGIYIQAIEGLGEFDEGSDSGWMYRVNGVYPQVSAGVTKLKDGDYVEWLYTRDLGVDIGGGFIGGVTPQDIKAAAGVETLIDAIGKVTKDSKTAIETARKAYDALTDVQKKLVTNYEKLVAAEKAYAALTGMLPFTDVPEDYWALDAIRYVYDLGLMNGTSATTFSPEKTASRGMIVTILYRLEGTPAVTSNASFADVSADMYCADAVEWAVDNGIVGGYGNGLFGPDAPITREQLAAILYRHAAFKGYTVTAQADLGWFADVDQIGSQFLDAMEWANAEGLINGKENHTIDPRGNATRAQVAAVLMRYLENVAK